MESTARSPRKTSPSSSATTNTSTSRNWKVSGMRLLEALSTTKKTVAAVNSSYLLTSPTSRKLSPSKCVRSTTTSSYSLCTSSPTNREQERFSWTMEEWSYTLIWSKETPNHHQPGSHLVTPAQAFGGYTLSSLHSTNPFTTAFCRLWKTSILRPKKLSSEALTAKFSFQALQLSQLLQKKFKLCLVMINPSKI